MLRTLNWPSPLICYIKPLNPLNHYELNLQQLQETGDRRQEETGNTELGRQETGEVRQETGGRRQEAGDRRQETGDMRQ